MNKTRTATKLLGGVAVTALMAIGTIAPAQAADTGWNPVRVGHHAKADRAGSHLDADTGWNPVRAHKNRIITKHHKARIITGDTGWNPVRIICKQHKTRIITADTGWNPVRIIT